MDKEYCQKLERLPLSDMSQITNQCDPSRNTCDKPFASKPSCVQSDRPPLQTGTPSGFHLRCQPPTWPAALVAPMPRATRQTTLRWVEVCREKGLDVIFDDWAEEVDSVMSIGTRTARNREAIANSFAIYVREAYPTLANEWNQEGLLDRLYRFFCRRVECSRSKKHPGERMSYHSMLTLRWNVLGILNDLTQPDPIQAKANTDETYRWVKTVQNRLKLRSEVAEKMYFGPPEAKLLMATAMTDPVSPFSIA
ncbi:hypothetical protein JAAARDRAFT_580553 [Jaapia argillacea MUCL 33604]|uniref:Uncharacterized protein n=1 Tax=Jaapia argillacea MUCL 33604 TaxID=933084 RepID=A0A067PJF2_9AGAM|nr:hypothetical protein JAAARDRAFT_580553 [Jaapia argillacea MUCL 33604]